MTLFERIVIAADGSKNSKSAVIEGLRIGKTCNSSIFVISVIDSRALSSVSPEIQVQGSIDQMQTEAEGIVSDIKAHAEGQNITTSVLTGDPVNEITKFALSRDADLIVVGTQGKSGIERLFLGSVAEGVIRHAPCPVLVVKNKDFL
ncbi:MAG TPA: universal stress protein [Methanoregulaceae archaeon]|nr:universal stress protein [Methanoregulaceae archaeon]